MKFCSKCKIEYPATFIYFPKDNRKKDKLCSQCRKCQTELSKKYYLQNKDNCKQLCKNWNNKNKERVIQNRKNWRNKNRDKINKSASNWVKRNRKQHQANWYLRDKRIKQATPNCPIIRKQIKEIYLNCPKGYEVDHINPIKGKNISGLNVPGNLQYLTPKENKNKGNKFIPYIKVY